jgi:surface-anchored protein
VIKQLYALLSVLSLVAASMAAAPTCAASDINFTGGGADITFYFERPAQTWHAVLRQKGNTEATGLDTPFAGFSGIVGLGSDFSFNTLTTKIITNTSVNIGGTDFNVSSASGSPLFATGTADLGIRTRLREDTGAGPVDQFDSFKLGLNVGASTFNGNPLGGSGVDVGLIHWDALDNPLPLLDTSGGLFTTSFTNFQHVHRHWGFSELGMYDLAFNIEGVGGEYGDSSAPGSFRMRFSVVPEPSGLAMIGLSIGCLAFRRRRTV